MQKYFKIIFPFFALILMSIAGLSQEQSDIYRSTVIEQFKGKSYYIHFVHPGETLAEIAKVYEVSTDVIIAENPEAQKNLYVNQVLKIPVPNTTTEITTKPDPAIQVPKTASENPVKDVKSGQEIVKPEPLKTSTDIPVKTVVVLSEKATSDSPVNPSGEKQEAQDVQKVTQKQEGPYTEYVVQKKETLYGIAKKFGVGMEDIIEANPGLKVIENGMTLRIPKKAKDNDKSIDVQKTKPAEKLPAEKPNIKTVNEMPSGKMEDYQVQPKETLYSIAKAHNISIESLIALNPELADGLKAGLVIKVPVTGSKTEPIPPKEPLITPIQSQAVKPEEAEMASPCRPGTSQDKVYKVAMMLPFDLAESDSLLATDISQMKHAGAYKPFNFIQIYEGALLALDSLEKTGAKVKFYVYDSDAGNDTTKTRKILQKPEMKKMDLILGPVFAKSSATAARFAAKYDINIVNPLSKREEILKGNTSIFKVQPSDAAIADKLAAFIIRLHPGANVLVVRYTKKDDPELAKMLSQKIKSQLQQAGRPASSIPVNDIVYQTEFFGGVSNHLSTVKENIIIVLSNNTVFIPDFISRLNNLHKSHKIILMGSPEWEALDPETDYLVNLNYHQYSFSWIDYSRPSVIEFRKKFQTRFASEPENDKYAFLGYDMTLFFVKALMDYGHDFSPCIINQESNADAPFKFRKSGNQDGYENTNLHILKIEDYHWVDAEK